MQYITMADLEGRLPLKFLVEALDDDSDGAVDPSALDQVLQSASDKVDSYLEARFGALTNPLPKLVVEAARIFAIELIHERRGKSGDQNPAAKEADDTRARLQKIAEGTQPLTPTTERTKPSGVAITAPATTVSATGQNAV